MGERRSDIDCNIGVALSHHLADDRIEPGVDLLEHVRLDRADVLLHPAQLLLRRAALGLEPLCALLELLLGSRARGAGLAPGGLGRLLDRLELGLDRLAERLGALLELGSERLELGLSRPAGDAFAIDSVGIDDHDDGGRSALRRGRCRNGERKRDGCADEIFLH